MLTQPKRKPGRSLVNSNTKGLLAQIRELAYAKGPDAKLPTTEDLCVTYKTSKATLNTVLKTLEEQNVITRRQGSGIYVSQRIHHKTIAVVYNSFLLGANASPFWGMLLSQFAEHAATRGQEASQDFAFFMTSPTAEPQGQLPDHVKRTVQAGVINGVIGISLNIDSVQWLLDQGVPCAAYGVWSKWTVATASDRFIQAGLQALADQGCRHIEYWGLPRKDDADPHWYEETCQIVETAYRAVGLTPPQTMIGPARDCTSGPRLPSAERAYIATKALFGDHKHPHPDGIFIDDDVMASGVLLGLMECGVRVGVDIKIASRANRNSPILFGHKRNLVTLLEFDPAEIAESLIHLAEQAMANPDLPETEISVPWRIQLPTETGF